MKFKIYAGVSNLHNGAEYKGTFEFNNGQEAEQYARDEAIVEYQQYEGTAHKSIDMIADDNEIDMDTDAGYDSAMDLYKKEMETWIEYWVE